MTVPRPGFTTASLPSAQEMCVVAGELIAEGVEILAMRLIISDTSISIFAIIFFTLLNGLPAQAVKDMSLADAGNGVFGGIELSDEGVKAIVLQVSQNKDEPEFRRLYSDFSRLSLGRTSSGDFPPQASADAANAILTMLNRLRAQYRVPLERIYFIGSSGLAADHPNDLEAVIRTVCGLDLKYLDPVTETQLSIAGVIPMTEKVGAGIIDERNSSALIHIGGASTEGGYEILKYGQNDSPSFDFIAMSLPQGVMTYSNEISKVVDANLGVSDARLAAFIREVKASGAISFRKALRKEIESKPGLAHRKGVFLTGNLVWAMATLLYPEVRGAFVPIEYEAIEKFVDRIERDPKEFAYQSPSFISNRKLRMDVERDMEQLRSTFTPQQLIAGAEMLKAAAEELGWKDKKIIFARYGDLGCLLSYIHLQASK